MALDSGLANRAELGVSILKRRITFRLVSLLLLSTWGPVQAQGAATKGLQAKSTLELGNIKTIYDNISTMVQEANSNNDQVKVDCLTEHLNYVGERLQAAQGFDVQIKLNRNALAAYSNIVVARTNAQAKLAAAASCPSQAGSDEGTSVSVVEPADVSNTATVNTTSQTSNLTSFRQPPASPTE